MAGRIDEKWPWPVGGLHGVHAEEIKALQKLEKNPSASPMPQAAPTRLLTPNQSSEDLRLGDANGAIGGDSAPAVSALTHVVLRNLRLKRMQAGWQSFSQALDFGVDSIPPKRVDQMRTMGRREERMLDMVEEYNRLAETVYGQLLSESKG